jgi:hypothetical protein
MRVLREMMDARLIFRQELVVELDYGQFYLHTANVDPDQVAEVVDQAMHGDGIAQSGGVLVVESPNQNNFEMPLTIEIWDAVPADDLTEWEEVFEAHLEVASAGIVYESPTMEPIQIDAPPGSYHAQITGRGFAGVGWPGSTEPKDEWRLRLWPSPGPDGPRRLSMFSEPAAPHAAARRGSVPPSFQGTEDLSGCWLYTEDGDEDRRRLATEAARRIGADLDRATGSRLMSGRTADVVLAVVMLREAGALWPLFAQLDVTSMSGPVEAKVGNEFTMSHSWREEDLFAGSTGSILCRWTELAAPNRVAMTWRWIEDPYPGTPRLARDSHLAFALSDVSAVAVSPATRVILTHRYIPAEWVEDMTAIWLSKFDQWAYQSRPTPRRRR